MGEETFGSPEHMTVDQIKHKIVFWNEKVDEVQKEIDKRKAKSAGQ